MFMAKLVGKKSIEVQIQFFLRNILLFQDIFFSSFLMFIRFDFNNRTNIGVCICIRHVCDFVSVPRLYKYIMCHTYNS